MLFYDLIKSPTRRPAHQTCIINYQNPKPPDRGQELDKRSKLKMTAKNKPAYLEVLFNNEVKPEDLQIIAQGNDQEPGKALLNQARLGQPAMGSPATPVHSRTGAKIGFLVYDPDLCDPPFYNTYIIEEVPTNGNA
jgi:hypothetical protein